MKKLLVSLIAIGCLQFVVSSDAQVPGIINYQGRVAVGGTNFDGTGLFKFALVNSGASQTYWSNGNYTVSLTVTKGLYSVLLGDTTIPHMNWSVPPEVFTNSDVRLRVWFNDGVSGLQQLSPDQRIGAVGYAISVATLNVYNNNTLVGLNAGNFTMSGYYNTASGVAALWNNTSGIDNTANGSYALAHNTSGGGNTAIGNTTLQLNTNGENNTAIGSSALGGNTSGSGNIALGSMPLTNSG